jgi:hypothetical protein
MEQVDADVLAPEPPVLDQIYEYRGRKFSPMDQNNVLNAAQAIELWQQGQQAWNAWADSHAGWTVDFSYVDFSLFRGEDLREISFKGYHFPGKTQFDFAKFGTGTVSFGDVSFERGSTSFVSVEFGPGNISFYRTRFGGIAVLFDNSRWADGHVYFNRTDFGNGIVSFNAAQFGNGTVHFNGARFGRIGVSFKETHFGRGRVSFVKVQFGSGSVSFEKAEFGVGNILFESAVFGEGGVSFKGACFDSGELSFRMTRFGRGVLSLVDVKASEGSIHFSSNGAMHCKEIDFSGAQIASVLNISGIKTAAVVNFCHAKLCQPVDFIKTDIDFRRELVCGYFERAVNEFDASSFRCLRKMAAQTCDRERELDFFVKEKRASYWHGITGTKLALYYLYDWCSDYGRSILRPLLFLLIVWLSFAHAYLGVSDREVSEDSRQSALVLSASHTIPIYAVSKDARIRAQNILYSKEYTPSAIYYLGVTQSLLSSIFIFLIGLALRNRFRQ